MRLELEGAKEGPSKICRRLLKEGHDPSTTIEVYRDGTLCFTSPTTIGAWAKIQVSESAGLTITTKKYKEFPRNQ